LKDEIEPAPQLLEDVTSIVQEAFGWSETLARPWAEKFCCAMSKRCGGLYIYKSESKEARDFVIRQEYDGSNREELMRRYGVSATTFWRIVTRRR